MKPFVLQSLAKFAGALLGAWLLLFVLLEWLPTAGGDVLALRLHHERLAVTLPLLVLATLVAVSLGVLLAWLAARWNSWADGALALLSTILAYLPPFWLGLLLALVFSGLPASGFMPWSSSVGGALASLLLPALALGLPHAGQLALRLRAAFGSELDEQEIRRLRLDGSSAANARWLVGSRRVLLEAPRLIGRMVAAMLVAAVVVESVFYLPGLGRLVLGSAVSHDLPLLRSSLFLLIALATSAMLVISLARIAIDPKLRAKTP